MGIWDKIKGEFVDIIEWTDSTTDTMVYRFERHGNEIKYGAKLTVRESQVAVFVDEGRFADVFPPGMYTLETSNLPVLSTLKGWAHGFNSPFKSEIYFVNTKRFNDLKWGTMNPIMMRDADFGMVRVRAFGTYAMRVVDAKTFLQEVVGTNWQFTTDEISNQLRNYLVSGFAEAIAQKQTPVLDLYSHYDDMGDSLAQMMGGKFSALGVELLDLMIENVSVPPEVEQAIDTRSKMGAVGNLDNFMKFQAGDAMVKGAENPGGAGAIGAQMAAGMMVGHQVSQSMNPSGGSSAAPPPVPSKQWFIAVDGQQHGPYTAEQMKEFSGSGRLSKDSLVWSEGMAEWKKAGDVPEATAFFGVTPPPIPPAPPAPPESE
ncbi:SPFH domain-containing protein [Kamptonema cortianum]|nr:SPFH domain-containing protein [Geitlerinema splendidum]MDK3156300.1 SPFH domain-containing protein [Kamptonema cortianum]